MPAVAHRRYQARVAAFDCGRIPGNNFFFMLSTDPIIFPRNDQQRSKKACSIKCASAQSVFEKKWIIIKRSIGAGVGFDAID